MFSQLITQLAEAEQVNEALKACNQMEWVSRMKEQKRVIELSGDEYRTMFHYLIGFRNQLIWEDI